jgi:hypothetical protein
MAKDLFHDIVKLALIAEGWEITHDPFPVDYGDVQMQIDLGAERLLAAQRDSEKIAVEVKSFTHPQPSLSFTRLSVNILTIAMLYALKKPTEGYI